MRTCRLARRHPRRDVSVGIVLVLALLPALALAACGSSNARVPPPRSSASPSATASVDIPVQTVRFTTADGVTLAGALYGRGTVAIILSNEGNNASAPWQPIAQFLAAHGYLVLSYSYRPSAPDYAGLAAHSLTDLRAAVSFMRARRVTRLILIGASLGALDSLKAATDVRCDGLIAISAPLSYQDVQLSDGDLRRLAMPKLFVTSADNQPFASDTLHMFDAAPEPKEKRVYPGDAHGTSLFAGASSADLLAAVLTFVQRYAPAR